LVWAGLFLSLSCHRHAWDRRRFAAERASDAELVFAKLQNAQFGRSRTGLGAQKLLCAPVQARNAPKTSGFELHDAREEPSVDLMAKFGWTANPVKSLHFDPIQK
jgi:hypothetical protein